MNLGSDRSLDLSRVVNREVYNEEMVMEVGEDLNDNLLITLESWVVGTEN